MNKKLTPVRLTLGLSKLRRLCLAYFRPEKTKKLLEMRRGECRQCGACCKLMFNCPALEEKKGVTECKIYEHRSRICRLFLSDKRDLSDRNLAEPVKKCGFWFEKI